jgi:alkanesulfonate monooxygenase SsuD/methylene tetrahydromethanopterin reductase-like flavin-dependent oxidoreductase (luciferase family)
LYAYPLPVQGANVPIFYGMKPSERNFARMAANADGWMAPPIVHSPETLAPHLDQLKTAWEKQGRDPATLRVSLMPRPVKHNENDKYADINATLAQLPALEKAGVDHVRLYPFQYTDRDGYDAWLDKVAKAQ